MRAGAQTASNAAVFSLRRRLALALTLLLILIAAAVVAAELALRTRAAPRIVFLNELHPYVMFRPPVHYTWKSDQPSPSSRKGEYAVADTNSDGLRIESPDYKLPRTKPPGQIRIAMLGGSTVHVGTRFNVTLPGALKRALRSRYPGRDIEVINAGIISAISRQELIFLVTTVLEYSPDIVITYDGINDTGQMLYFERRPNFPYFYRALENAWNEFLAQQRNPLWRLLASRSAVAQALSPGKFRPPQVSDPVPPEELIVNPQLRQTYAHAHRDNWRRIGKICAAYGIEPFFILQPTSLYGVFPSSRRDDRSSPALYANYLVYQDFRTASRELASLEPGIHVLDMSDAFPDPKLYHDGAHVYDDVNDLIAKRIADFVRPVIGKRSR